uniref:Uncharacterized protein n=1 Tax=Tanacetum cinerariifolium TaxID=118510 RepID=A0A6L2N9B1_TANCI|nr:hypothetical protein [Tanacetum cinerariifolium]
MANLLEDIQCAGSDTRPPMLDRTDFASWQQRIRLYCQSKENGVNILKSIDEGPYNADIWATNILLQGLPKDIYTLINHYTDAKYIWDNVKMLLEGSKLAKEDMESQLYDDFEHFRQKKGENIYGRFVTAVKLNKGLRDSNYDQLYAYLKRHKAHANENKMMLDRFTKHTVDSLALMSNVSHQQYYSQSSTTPPSTYVQPHFGDNTQLDLELSLMDNLGRQNRGQGNNARGVGAAGYEGAQNRVRNANPDKMLLMQTQENRVSLDDEQLLFIVDGQDNVVDEDVDEQPIQDLALNVDNKKVATGYKNSLYLTRAQKVQPALYNGHEIIKTNHVSAMKQLTPEQIFWSKDLLKMKVEALKEQTTASRPIKVLTVYPLNTLAMLVLRVQSRGNTIRELREKISRSTKKHSDADPIHDLKALDSHSKELHAKFNAFYNLNEHWWAENEKVKRHYKELYDSIKIKSAKTIEETSSLLTEVANLKAQITENHKSNCVTMFVVKSKVLAPGIKGATATSGSKPRSNTKKDRTFPAKSDIKKVEVHPRNNKSSVKRKNHVDSSISYKRTVINLNSNYVFKTCNKCLLNPTKIRDPMYQTLHLRLSSNAGRTDRPLVFGLRLFKTYDGGSLTAQEFCKKFIETVRFGNGHFGAIMGYGDYVIGDNVISRVYYVKGLGHNLFYVRQFCDSNMEVTFRKHSFYVRDTDSVELIKGSRGYNLYTISVKDMMMSSLTYLLYKASKNKSWLWHRCLNHLNFGTINDLARKDLLRSLPRLKFEKDHICFACQLGKSKKHTHIPKTKNTNLEVLNTLYMDVCRPMRVQIINGKKYILVIVMTIRGTCRHFLPKNSFEDSTAERIVERQNRTLVEAARTMLIFSKAPIFLWAEVVATASDIGIFFGYEPSRKGYRIYNKRIRRIMETIHIQFDEPFEPMAHVQLSTRPALTFLTPGQISLRLVPNLISSGLVPNLVPANPYAPLTNKELEILFQPMFDEYLEPLRAKRSGSPAQAVQAPVTSAGPAPTFLTPGQISSGLVPNSVPTSPYVPPTNKYLEILFQPMFDEYLEPPRVERPVSPAPAVPVLVNSVGMDCA